MTTRTQQRNGTQAVPEAETGNPPTRKIDNAAVEYIPLGEKAAVKLSPNIVRQYIAVKTRSGATPTDQDIVKFINLCKARELNPWVGDAYLVGYDSKDGPVFNLITAAQALWKRAEINPNFDGLESGVIVLADGQVIERVGDFTLPTDKLVGAWAKAYRKDQRMPVYDRINLSTFSTGRSRWAADPAGMIVKCAEASVLRRAFPNQISGLYIAEEIREAVGQLREEAVEHKAHATRTEALAAALAPPTGEESQDTGEAADETPEPPAEHDGRNHAAELEAMVLGCESADDLDTANDEIAAALEAGQVDGAIADLLNRKLNARAKAMAN